MGTVVNPSSSNKGAWAQLYASTTSDAFGLLICINTNTLSASSRGTLVDIGIGDIGSEVVLVPDLVAGNAGAYIVGGIWYYFPIFIPAGTRVSARGCSSRTTAFNVYTQLLGAAANPSQVRKASFAEAIGVSTVTEGVPITPGTTTKSNWVLLGTTTQRLWWWQFGAQVATTDTTHGSAAVNFDIAVGNGTTYDIIINEAQLITTTSEAAGNPPISAGVEFPVAAGTNVYARAWSSANADPMNVVAYGAGG